MNKVDKAIKDSNRLIFITFLIFSSFFVSPILIIGINGFNIYSLIISIVVMYIILSINSKFAKNIFEKEKMQLERQRNGFVESTKFGVNNHQNKIKNKHYIKKAKRHI